MALPPQSPPTPLYSNRLLGLTDVRAPSQINGIGTETKKVADLMQGEVQLSITVLRRRTTNNRKSASSSSADEDTTGRQSEVKKGGGLGDDDH